MRLVGATDGFIRRPFLFEGLLAGMVGGFVAAVLTYSAYRLVNLALIEVAWLPASWAFLGVVAGALYGLLSSAVAVRQHLRVV